MEEISAGFLIIRGSAIRKPDTSVQFSYTSAFTARATRAPVMSLPPREKVVTSPFFFAP